MSRLTCAQSAALEQIVNATSVADVIRELALIDERIVADRCLWGDDKDRERRAKRLNAFALRLEG